MSGELIIGAVLGTVGSLSVSYFFYRRATRDLNEVVDRLESLGEYQLLVLNALLKRIPGSGVQEVRWNRKRGAGENTSARQVHADVLLAESDSSEITTRESVTVKTTRVDVESPDGKT